IQVGRGLSLLRDVNVGNRLKRGAWRVLFVDQSCPRCQDLLAAYFRPRSNGSPRLLSEGGTAVIETRRAEHPIDNHGNTSIVIGRLSQSSALSIRVPLEIELMDGVVVATR
ncbi:MAG: hypothetical protein ACREJM_11190, partial [Candidatus Saccharimonadales bacterium]